jgi:biopolymer transport protein ExbD
MIERPKRAVTRFFVPLIDVLILLFCIFLLMPFTQVPTEELLINPPDSDQQKKKDTEELPKDVQTLQRELEKARRELSQLKMEKGNLSDRLSVKVLEIDPRNGNLYYLQDRTRVVVDNQLAADTIIRSHTNQAKLAGKEPFFLLLFPREATGFPEQSQIDTYSKWFKEVQYQFDKPFR